MTRQVLVVAALASFLAVGGCTQYYRVTDPSSGRSYYTTRIDKNRGGAVEFDDARTGSRVTIQNSEVTEIKQEQYDVGRFQAPAPTTPAK